MGCDIISSLYDKLQAPESTDWLLRAGPYAMTQTNPFSAADSALGYLYQIRVALLWALRRLKKGEFTVSLETLDDVTFESKGTPAELLQTKHHTNRKSSLTNASEDLWKTLRIWLEGNAGKTIPSGASLHLLTTGIAPEGSVAAYLRSDEGRDIESALKGLLATAQSSSNAANSPAYKAFLQTTPKDRERVLANVFVFDAAPNIARLGEDLTNEVFWAVEREHHEAFLERLEGWWFRRVLKQLTSNLVTDRILAAEIEAQMSDLREQFKQASLPIDDDLLVFDLDDATQAAHSESAFVRQLEIIAASKKRIAAAIRDYYRAFEQRSRWLRNDLVLIGDLSQYERRLTDEWELIFEGVKDEIGSTEGEEIKKQAAREVLKWAESVSLPIRPNVTEPFVARGSLHMLADELRIGWHPDFRERLATVLQSRGTVA